MILEEYLKEKLKGASRTKIKQLLSSGAVRVNGRMCTRYNYEVADTDKVDLAPRNQSSQSADFNRMQRQGRRNAPLKIVYEDDYLLVIDKHEGLLSVGTGGENELTAHSLLNAYVKENNGYVARNQYAREPRVFIVHRLDRETSGLMVFAKDEYTKNRMQRNWEELVTMRRYAAVVDGLPDEHLQAQGTVTSWLRENRAFVVYSSPVDNGGQLAVTDYKVLQSSPRNRKTLLELDLHTGRKNQIRVHMQECGHPIYGDRKYYGADPELLAENKKARRLYLHAFLLNFIHPHTGKEMDFSTKIPQDFLNMVK